MASKVEIEQANLNQVEKQTDQDVVKTKVEVGEVKNKPEVESFLEKVERRFARIPKGVPGVQDDQVIIQNQTQGQQPVVHLPITQKALQTKVKSVKIQFSIVWLVSWAKRRIKQLMRLGKRVVLADLPEVEEDK